MERTNKREYVVLSGIHAAPTERAVSPLKSLPDWREGANPGGYADPQSKDAVIDTAPLSQRK